MRPLSLRAPIPRPGADPGTPGTPRDPATPRPLRPLPQRAPANLQAPAAAATRLGWPRPSALLLAAGATAQHYLAVSKATWPASAAAPRLRARRGKHFSADQTGKGERRPSERAAGGLASLRRQSSTAEVVPLVFKSRGSGKVLKHFSLAVYKKGLINNNNKSRFRGCIRTHNPGMLLESHLCCRGSPPLPSSRGRDQERRAGLDPQGCARGPSLVPCPVQVLDPCRRGQGVQEVRVGGGLLGR